MDLRHVRYFVAVADHGTVSAAASAVHVTQPALSRQLRQLERDLGLTLFDRSAGRLALNRPGRELLPMARALLTAAADLGEAATFHAHGRVERLTIAAPTVTLTDLVAPFVATLCPEDPVIDVEPSDGLAMADMLVQGADIAISTQHAHSPVESRVLGELPVWAYVPPEDGWAARGQVTIDELLGRAVIALPRNFTAREALEAATQDAESSFSELIEAANGTIAQALAASGRGVAVVSDDPRFGLKPVRILADGKALRIRLVAGWDSRGVAAAVMRALTERLAAWIDDHYGAAQGEL